MQNLQTFTQNDLMKLYVPPVKSNGEDNGQITIIGGSKLFHGAPIMALKTAVKFVDMVFFASPEGSLGKVAEQIKAQVLPFIWVPWKDVNDYISKSDSVLIGPGFMRFATENRSKTHHTEDLDHEGQKTYEITKTLLNMHKDKKWVIDAGSLQVIKPTDLPVGCIITPNNHEYSMLFGDLPTAVASKNFKCTIVRKGPTTLVATNGEVTEISGGNPGLTKGGTGDVLAGLTTALFAKNDAHLAACAASFIQKRIADKLFSEVKANYSAEDLADNIAKY